MSGEPNVMPAYWGLPSDQLLAQLKPDASGLTQREAHVRLKRYGPNSLKSMTKATALGLVLILIVASCIFLAAERSNCVFMSTSVNSGTAQALIVQTGKVSVFGQITDKLPLASSERAGF
ncbi:MAG: hypothetical protein HQ445_04665 [Polaromonas sp.]|nr:hypothetical protein [Polaromonas sp.]